MNPAFRRNRTTDISFGIKYQNDGLVCGSLRDPQIGFGRLTPVHCTVGRAYGFVLFQPKYDDLVVKHCIGYIGSSIRVSEAHRAPSVPKSGWLISNRQDCPRFRELLDHALVGASTSGLATWCYLEAGTNATPSEILPVGRTDATTEQ